MFFGALSDTPFEVQVLDTETGSLRTYRNASGTFASFGDTDAFAPDRTLESTLTPPPSGAVVRADSRSAPSPCVASSTIQCQRAGRFAVSVRWRDFEGRTGDGEVRPLGPDIERFWFFDSENVELVVKVLDGRPLNGQFWVYAGSLTNVAFDLEVTDTETGEVRTYSNPLSNFASFGDVTAFD